MPASGQEPLARGSWLAARGPKLDWEALFIILASKLAAFLIIVVAYELIPFRGSSSAALNPDNPSFWSSFRLWDSASYIALAEEGYAEGEVRNAFAPLLPFMMRALNFLTGDSIASGLLISNVASAIGLYLFTMFARRYSDREAALRALVLFLAFPTAFYLNLVYTEGLFLLLAMLFFIALYQKAYLWAAVAAFFVTITRPQGIFILAPFGVFLLLDAIRSQKQAGADPSIPKLVRALLPALPYLVAPLLALGLYFLYMEAATGDAFAAIHAQDRFISDRSAVNLLKPWMAVEDMFTADLTAHGFQTSVIDRLFFCGFLASLPVVYRYTDKPLFSFYLLMGLEPLLGSYMSYTRYLMLAFPLYIAYAVWSVKPDLSPYLICGAIFPMVALQALFIALHSLNYWVA